MIIDAPVVLEAFHFLRSDCTKTEYHLKTQNWKSEVNKRGGDIFLNFNSSIKLHIFLMAC